jgi:hypothetical protein
MLRPAVDRLPPRASGRRRPRSARGPATHANERTPSLHHRVGRPPAGRSTRFPCAITSPPVPRVPRVAGCPHEGPRSRAIPRAAISRGTLRHDLRMTTRGFFVCSRLVTLVEPGFLRNCHALRREMDDRARAAARCIASAWEGSGSARSEMPIRQATREFPFDDDIHLEANEFTARSGIRSGLPCAERHSKERSDPRRNQARGALAGMPSMLPPLVTRGSRKRRFDTLSPPAVLLQRGARRAFP